MRTRIAAAVVAISTIALLGPTPPAAAVPLLTVTWTNAGLSPTALPLAVVGAMLSVTNTSDITVALHNATGAISSNGIPCNGVDALCEVDNQGQPVYFDVSALGTISIVGPAPQFPVLAILTLGPVSGSGTNPVPDATILFNGNGATSCTPASATGPRTASYSLPSAANCQRPGYRLLGWSLQSASTAPDNANLTQPADPLLFPRANFADSGELFAVWLPLGVQVEYDANVNLKDSCLVGSANRDTAAARRSAPTVVDPGAASATSAPCTPPGLALRGWSTKPGLPAVAAAGAALPPTFSTGSSVVLYAVWGPECTTAYSFSGGLGTKQDAYLIADSYDLQCLRDQPTLAAAGKAFAQTADIDMAGQVWTAGIGPDATGGFVGSYDGRGHQISNLTITPTPTPASTAVDERARITGLFERSSGSITELTFTGTVAGTGIAGGLVGSNNGQIRNCSTAGTVSGYDDVGGLVGANTGSVTRSTSSAAVTGHRFVGGVVGLAGEGSTNEYLSASGPVAAERIVGGLVGGTLDATVRRSHASGDVRAEVGAAGGLVGWVGSDTDLVTLSYATGDVTGKTWLGGLVGGNRGSVSRSFATGDVVGTGELVGGLVGYAIDDTGGSRTNVGITDSYARGAVSGTARVGGLVGSLESPIRRSYSTGRVQGSNPGGLVGQLNRLYVSNDSFWDTQTSQQSTSAAGTGRSTAQMTTQATFAGASWTFTTASEVGWRMCAGVNDGYPVLVGVTPKAC